MELGKYSKAIAGGIVAFLTALGTAITDQVVTPGEWIAVALATVLGTGIVYASPANKSSGDLN